MSSKPVLMRIWNSWNSYIADRNAKSRLKFFGKYKEFSTRMIDLGIKRRTENELSSYPDKRLLWIKHHWAMIIVINGQTANMFLKIEPTGFSDGLDVVSEKKREVKDDRSFFCLIQLIIDDIYWHGRRRGRGNFNRDSERNKQCYYEHFKIEISTRNLRRDVESQIRRKVGLEL